MKFFNVITSMLALLCIAPTYAQDSVSTDYYSLSLEDLLDLTVISATKNEETILDAPSNITVITEQNIKEWGSRDLKDVIRRVIGYQVIPDRDEWCFAARGNVSDNNQKYLILVDGVRMNSIENFGPGNIIEIPNNLSNVKQIEVIKGPGSAVWGSDALAGVINIITKTADDLNENVNISLTAGEDSYYLADFQVGKKIDDNAEIIFMGAFSGQEGRKVVQHAATSLPIMDSTFMNQSAPFGTYTTTLDKHRAGYMFQMKAKVDNFKINAYTLETEVFNRHFEYGKGRENYLTTNKTFVEGQFQDTYWTNTMITAKVGYGSNHSEYRPGTQGDSTKLPFNLVWKDRGIKTSLEILQPIKQRSKIYAGMDYQFTKLGPNQRINSINPDDPTNTENSESSKRTGYWFDRYSEDHQIGGYIMGDISTSDFYKISIGTRADFNNQRGTDHFNINPRAAILLFPMEETALKAVYNKGYLRPANFQGASENVGSETMDEIDIIWMQTFWKLQYSVTGYWQKLNGFINIAEGFGFSNTGDYTSTGVELDARMILSEKYSLWTNAAYSMPKGSNFKEGLAPDSRRVDIDGNLLSYANSNANIGGTFYFLNQKGYISPAIRYMEPIKYRSAPVAFSIEDTLNDEGETESIKIYSEDAEENYQTTKSMIYFDVNIGYKINNKFEANIYIDNALNVTEAVPLTVWNGTVEQYGRHISFKLRANL